MRLRCLLSGLRKGKEKRWRSRSLTPSHENKGASEMGHADWPFRWSGEKVEYVSLDANYRLPFGRFCSMAAYGVSKGARRTRGDGFVRSARRSTVRLFVLQLSALFSDCISCPACPGRRLQACLSQTRQSTNHGTNRQIYTLATCIPYDPKHRLVERTPR